jgi:hypothetical protein
VPHKTTKKGYDQRKDRIRHLQRVRPIYVVEIRSQDTTPTNRPDPRWAKSKTVKAQLKPRSAGENARIINSQAKKGRKFAYVDHKEFKKMQAALRQQLNLFEQGAPAQVIVKGVKGIGQKIVDHYHRNLEREKSPRRKFKALAKSYERTKKAIWGDKPILERTGQLARALFVSKVRKQ